MTTPRCGDTVLHKPSGEKWLVAYADPARDELSWSGWPEGYAKLSDCELIRQCSDDEHEKAVSDWLDKPRRDNDHRPGVIERLYRN